MAYDIPCRSETSSPKNGHLTDFPLRSLTPNPNQNFVRRPSYSKIELSREATYNLDYPEDAEETERLQLDPNSRFFARKRPRTLNLPKLLPYSTERPVDRAKFLSHIVSHLYIAIKSLDIQGSLSITAKDLASLRIAGGFSDVDMALETNLFEMDKSNLTTADTEEEEDVNNFFADDDLGDSETESDDEDDEDDDDLEDDENGSGDSAAQHKKSPKSAAVVSVRIWTHELLVWLKMKYDMPLSLRANLARVYYAICLCRGQEINLKIYVKTFETLTKDFYALQEYGFKLPWEDLCNELTNHFPCVDGSLENFEKKNARQLLRLSDRASCFFDKSALPIIYSRLGSKFSFSNGPLVLSTMAALPLSFTEGGEEDIYDIRHYIASFFYLWTKLSESVEVDSHLTARLGTIATMSLVELTKPQVADYLKLGNYGVFSESQMEYLMKRLINSLSIMKEKYGSLKTDFFHGFASAIVFSIVGTASLKKGGLTHQLKTLLNAVGSYVHPSNSGDWTRPISKLVVGLVYQLHKRFNLEREKNATLMNLPQEYKLKDSVIDEFVTMFLPIVRTGIQSKKSNAADDYLSCIPLLAHMRPSMVLEYFLSDIYESLEGVISTHRVTIALRSIEELARYFASTPVFRVHLTRIMSYVLLGIDSNDLEKTIHSLNTIATIANFVPFHDLTNGEGTTDFAIQFTTEHLEYLRRKVYSNEPEFVVDEELEVEALKSSSVAFGPLIKTLSERVFRLLENIPDPSKSTGIEKDLCDSLPKFLYVMFESLSDPIFKSFRDEYLTFITENTYHTIADVIAEIGGGLIKRDPKYIKIIGPMLMDKIKEEITENGAGASRTGVDVVPRDQSLFWNLIILNECIGNGGKYIVSIGEELNDFSFYVMEHVRGPAVFSSSYLLNQMLQAVTKIRLNESRLIPPLYAENNEISEKCWGGFQFDDYRFSAELLSFSWFIPTEREVKFAVDTFTKHALKNLENILKIVKNYSTLDLKDGVTSLKVADELRMNFLYLGYAISGISFLLDPSFDEDIPKISGHLTESIQQRLLLLKQIRRMKESKSLSNDDLRSDNLHENLQKIVEDMGNKDLTEYMFDISKLEEGIEDKLIKDNEDRMEVDTKTSTDSTNNSDLDLVNDKSQTDLPLLDESARATPRIEGFDMSAINPGITFRERKLYTCRYFFGDDIETRRSNDLYLKIHKIRHLIGKSMHIIGKFMLAHLQENTKLFKHYLYVVSIWFSDVGRERLLEDSHAKISSGYISAIQRINRVRKPFTRILLGSRIESYHLLRVALHSSSRTQTDLDKLLLEDVVKLSFSNYSAVSTAAQTTLADAMKRLNGSYNVITRLSLRFLAKALEEKNLNTIESGLNIFELPRIKTKIQNDYFNLQKFVELLHSCLSIDSKEVNEISQKLFRSLNQGVSSPSPVCIIDHTAIDTIRPPDDFIDLEIKAVRFAKEKKRKLYHDKLKKLEDSLYEVEKSLSHWKISSLVLSLLIELQINLQMPTRSELMQLLTKAASSDHPIVSRIAVKGISKVINKLYLLQLYDYDIRNCFDFAFTPKDFKIIKTFSPGTSYTGEWKKELADASPDYFIDQKASSGWLFWDESMLAVTNEPCNDLRLNPHDASVLKLFGENLTKDWFLNIVKLWVADNETVTAYQGADVFMTSTLVLLISTGDAKNFTFEELLEIIEEIYVPDEKSSHIVACELIAGCLIASKYISSSVKKTMDAFISKFLINLLENDLSPDNSGVWNIFAWWVPAHIDCRRFPEVINTFTEFRIDANSDSAIKTATRLSYVRAIIAAVTWTFSDPQSILTMCFQNINNPYQAVRDEIGCVIAVTSFIYFPDSYASGQEFTQLCNNNSVQKLIKDGNEKAFFESIPDLFKQIEKWRLQVEHLTPQEILKTDYIYSATTVLTWLRQALHTSLSVLYQDLAVTHIIPFLLKLISMKEVCQLGDIDPITTFKKVSQIPYSKEVLEKVVTMLENFATDDLNFLQLIIIGEFTETVYFKNLFYLSQPQRKRIIEITNKLMYHKNAQVRESSASTLSGLIHTSPPDEVEAYVQEFIQKYSNDLDHIRKRHRKSGFKNLSQDEIIFLHGATLGLGALVHAFAFFSPPPKWVPNVLTILSIKASGIPGIVGKTAKDSLGKFKKNRQDTWHVDVKVFHESQIQDLEGVLWKSYFI